MDLLFPLASTIDFHLADDGPELLHLAPEDSFLLRRRRADRLGPKLAKHHSSRRLEVGKTQLNVC